MKADEFTLWKNSNSLFVKSRKPLPDERETLEQYLARGGTITRLPPLWEIDRISEESNQLKE